MYSASFFEMIADGVVAERLQHAERHRLAKSVTNAPDRRTITRAVLVVRTLRTIAARGQDMWRNARAWGRVGAR
jgi:hypothetical protein